VTLVTDLQVKAFVYIWILKASVCSLTVLANENPWSYCFNQRSQVAPFGSQNMLLEQYKK